MLWRRRRRREAQLPPDGPATIYPGRSGAWLRVDGQSQSSDPSDGGDTYAHLGEIGQTSDMWHEPTRYLRPLRVPPWLGPVNDDEQ